MQAALHGRDVARLDDWLGVEFRRVELRRQMLAATRLPLRRVREHPARSEDERAYLVGIPNLASP